MIGEVFIDLKNANCHVANDSLQKQKRCKFEFFEIHSVANGCCLQRQQHSIIKAHLHKKKFSLTESVFEKAEANQSRQVDEVNAATAGFFIIMKIKIENSSYNQPYTLMPITINYMVY